MSFTAHLTDEQIDDLMIGDAPAELHAHLSECPDCQLRLAAAEAPMSSFRDISLAWAERQSATMPVPVAPESHAGLSGKAGWALGAALLLAVGVTVPFLNGRAELPESAHNAPSAPSVPEKPATPAAPAVNPAPSASTMAAVGHTGMSSVTPVGASQQQIQRDNEMLEAIDRELGAPDATLAAYAMEPQSSESRAARSHTVRD